MLAVGTLRRVNGSIPYGTMTISDKARHAVIGLAMMTIAAAAAIVLAHRDPPLARELDLAVADTCG